MADGITVTLELRLKPEAVDIFPQHAPRILESPSEFPGFRSLRIVQHKEDRARILFVEEWDSEEAYHAYLEARTQGGNIGQLAQIVSESTTTIWSIKLGEV